MALNCFNLLVVTSIMTFHLCRYRWLSFLGHVLFATAPFVVSLTRTIKTHDWLFFTIIRKHYDIQQSLKKQALAVGVLGWFMYIHSYVKTSSCPLLLKQLYSNVDVHGQMFDWCITFRIHSLFHFNFALILG